MSKILSAGAQVGPIATYAKFERMTLAALALSVLALTMPVVQAQPSVAVEHPQAPGNASIRAQLVGSWRLVSRESRRASGELEVDPGLSTAPMGVLTYDQSGHVAVQLSRRDRSLAMVEEECQAAATIKGTPDTAQTFLGYDAYFGTYSMNERDSKITHHLEASIWPGDIGKDIERFYKLSGDRLTLSFNTTTREGVKVTRTLVWERMK